MGLLDLIFPKKCLECKKEGKYICSECLEKLPPLGQICPLCKRASIDGFTHPKCLKKRGLNGLVSLWPYKGVIRRSIIFLKYKFVKEISRELSIYVLEKTKDHFLFKKVEGLITIVPLYWIRKNLRGYNQVEEIAFELAKRFDFRYVGDLIIRKKYRDPQVSLSKKERVKNVRGVFALNSKYKDILSNAFIIVVDDVFTTGSTLKEMAKVLKRSGAKSVWGLTIAR